MASHGDGSHYHGQLLWPGVPGGSRPPTDCFVLPAPWLVPAGGDVLELDEVLCCDIQLVDDRAEDIGIVPRLHLHVVAMTVRHREEDPLANVEDFPVCSAEGLERMKSHVGG